MCSGRDRGLDRRLNPRRWRRVRARASKPVRASRCERRRPTPPHRSDVVPLAEKAAFGGVRLARRSRSSAALPAAATRALVRVRTLESRSGCRVSARARVPARLRDGTVGSFPRSSARPGGEVMTRRRGSGSRITVGIVALATCIAALVVPAIATAPAGAAQIARPEGAGPPVKASGVGTTEALNNPKCMKKNPAGDDLYFGYGRFNSTIVGGGPVCVKPWKDGNDNGGATSQGVTKDKVTVVAVLPNETQLQSDPVTPKHLADKSPSTYEDAVYDYVLPQMKFYETWGRDLEMKFVTSSGSDEQSQRADVVKIEAMKPFAVFHLIVAGLDVLETELAKAKIPV